MPTQSNDPAEVWRTLLAEMEKGFNSFANQAMGSQEFSRVMNQAGGVSFGAQKSLGELMERYLSSLNLPSRAQLVNMGERLQAIENQLNEIKAMLHGNQERAGTSVAPAGLAPLPKPPRSLRGFRTASSPRSSARSSAASRASNISGRPRRCWARRPRTCWPRAAP